MVITKVEWVPGWLITLFKKNVIKEAFALRRFYF